VTSLFFVFVSTINTLLSVLFVFKSNLIWRSLSPLNKSMWQERPDMLNLVGPIGILVVYYQLNFKPYFKYGNLR